MFSQWNRMSSPDKKSGLLNSKWLQYPDDFSLILQSISVHQLTLASCGTITQILLPIQRLRSAHPVISLNPNNDVCKNREEPGSEVARDLFNPQNHFCVFSVTEQLHLLRTPSRKDNFVFFQYIVYIVLV